MTDYKQFDIRDVFAEYITHNDLTLSHVARVTDIPRTTLSDWYNGKVRMKPKNIHKIKLFMEEKYHVSVETVISYMENKALTL